MNAPPPPKNANFWGRLTHKLKWYARDHIPSRYPDATFESLSIHACNIVGSSDWGDYSFIPGLKMLIQSIREESGLHYFQRHRFFLACLDYLAKRLLIHRYYAENPAIAEVTIRKPLFVTGLPRTGTTFLHGLLSQDPHSKPLLYWEQMTPFPSPHPDSYTSDPRIESAKRTLDRFYERYPVLASIHHVDGEGSDECNGLFMTNFTHNQYFYHYNIPSYIEWYTHHDMHESYNHYKKQLQILGLHFQDRHWALKAPSHLYFLDVLFDTFPDACVVQTHRQPLESLPSACSLAKHARAMGEVKDHSHQIGVQWSQHLAQVTSRAIKTRESIAPNKILDISYKGLVADPIATVKTIYDHFGYNFSEDFQQRMRNYMSQNRQHKYGKHKYSAEEFGLDNTRIESLFTDYLHAYQEFL